jgi:hypothetical protein
MVTIPTAFAKRGPTPGAPPDHPRGVSLVFGYLQQMSHLPRQS